MRIGYIKKIFMEAILIGALLILSRHDSLKGMVFTASTIIVCLIFILNIIIDKKLQNRHIPEQYFENMEEDDLPESIRKYLSTANIAMKIMYYNSNEINSHLIQRNHCNYIILTSAVLQKLNTYEMAALIFHEIGHIKKSHHKKIRFYYGLRNAAFIVFISLCSCLCIKLSLSTLQALIFCFISIELFMWGLRLLLCWLQRNQEYDADKFVTTHLERKFLVSALNKTNKSFSGNFFSKHPNVSQRIDRISNYA